MSEFFDALQKIAKEEFGCTLVQGERRRTFKDLFGFSLSELIEDYSDEFSDSEVARYEVVSSPLANKTMGMFEVVCERDSIISLAA